MDTKIARIFDDCIDRLYEGESIDGCLEQYPDVQEELEPLLHTAVSVSTMEKVVPSDAFVSTLEYRLRTRYIEKQALLEDSIETDDGLWTGDLSQVWQRLRAAVTGAKRIVVPSAIGLLLLIVAAIGVTNLLSPSPTLASHCTLSILSGNAEVQKPESGSWKNGSDGMTLVAGTRIKTSADSHALLTFFEGSTLKLEPNTDIEIQKLESNEQQSTTIIVKQWLGKTWSRVVKMADPGSQYEIETPSAVAAVRGTLFTTEVDETGFTRVATTQGLVSVIAAGQEVDLPPSLQTQVGMGMTPSPPAESSSPPAEIQITIYGPAVGSVIDPSGASTGYLPDGSSFNQITGSQTSILPDGTQTITIVEPDSGDYAIALRYLSEGTAQFSIQGISDGEVVFEYTGNYQGTTDDGWLLRFNVDVADGLITGSNVVSIEPMTDESPEKIVKASSTGQNNQDKGQGNNRDDDQNKGQGIGLSNSQNNNQNTGSSNNQYNGQANNPDIGQNDKQDNEQNNAQDRGQGNAQDRGQNDSQNNGQNSNPDNGQGNNNNGQNDNKDSVQNDSNNNSKNDSNDNSTNDSNDNNKNDNNDNSKNDNNDNGKNDNKDKNNDNKQDKEKGNSQDKDRKNKNK